MKSKTHVNLEKLIQRRRFADNTRIEIFQTIYDHLIANSNYITRPNFSKISDADLGLLFQVTDELFFDGLVGKLCEQVADTPLTFRLSTRMTKSGGTTTMYRTGRGRHAKLEFEIAIATTPLFGSFPSTADAVSGSMNRVGGIHCEDRVQGLQRIMEHEMVHLAEMLLWGDSNCAAGPFKDIVYRFFGHTESNHQLLSPTDIARQKLGIRPGDQVIFDHQGEQIFGTVNRITKRASVLVPDPRGVKFTDGKHYSTYYVPLSRLQKAG